MTTTDPVTLDLNGVHFRHLGPLTKAEALREWADRYDSNTLPGGNARATTAEILRRIADQMDAGDDTSRKAGEQASAIMPATLDAPFADAEPTRVAR